MRKTIELEEKLLKVTVNIGRDYQPLVIEKCDSVENFEHGSDWILCLEKLEEILDLIVLLKEAAREFGLKEI